MSIESEKSIPGMEKKGLKKTTGNVTIRAVIQLTEVEWTTGSITVWSRPSGQIRLDCVDFFIF